MSFTYPSFQFGNAAVRCPQIVRKSTFLSQYVSKYVDAQAHRPSSASCFIIPLLLESLEAI